MAVFDHFSDRDKAELFDLLSTLFRCGSISKSIIDPDRGVYKSDPRYELCMAHEETLRDYLNILMINLCHDALHQTYYIQSDRAKGPALLPDVTYMLFVLRVLYDELLAKAKLQAVTTTLKDIRIKGQDTGLFTERMQKITTQRAVLTFLKQKNVIAYAGSVNTMTDETAIYINDTILLVMSDERMSRFAQAVEQAGLRKDPSDGETETEQTDTE